MAQVNIPVSSDAAKAAAGFKQLASSIKGLQSSLGGLQSALNGTAGAANRAGSATANAGRQATTAGNAFRSATGALRGFTGQLGGLRSAIAGAGIVALGTNIVQTAVKINGINMSLKAITGSAAAGSAAFKELSDISQQVGFRTSELGKSYIQLRAATEGTVLSGKATTDMFTGLARATAKFGGDTEDLKGALTAVQQIVSKGQVQMEELKGQLGERLPGAMRILLSGLRQVKGDTTITMASMIKDIGDGKMGAEEFFRAFNAGMANIPANTQTAGAAFARFQNELDKAKVTFANSGFLDGITEGMKQLQVELNKPETITAMKELGGAIGSMLVFMAQNIGTIKTFIAAMAGFVAFNAFAGFVTNLARGLQLLGLGLGVVARAAPAVVTGLRLVSVAMLTTPVGLLLTGMAALAALFIYAANQTKPLTAGQQKVKTATDNLRAATDDLNKVVGDPTSTEAAIRKSQALARQRLIQAQSARQAAIAEIQLAQAQLQAAQSRISIGRSMGQVGGDRMDRMAGRMAEAQGLDQQRAANARITAAQRSAAQLDAETRRLQQSIKDGDKAIADIRNTPKVPLQGVDSIKTDGGGSDKKDRKGGGGGGVDQYKQQTEDLNFQLSLLGRTEKEVAAMEALRAAGLKANINATDAKSLSIINLSNQLFDLQKRQADMKKSDDMLIESNNNVATAKAELLAATGDGAAEYAREVLAIDQSYDARIREIDAMNLTLERKQKLVDLAQEETQALKDAAKAAREKNQADFAAILQSREDAAFDQADVLAGRMTEDEARRAEALRAVEERRLQLIEDLKKNFGESHASYADMLAKIEAISAQERDNVDEEIKKTKQKETIQQMADLFEGLFTNPRATMKAFFADLLKKLLMAIAYAIIFKTTMGAALGATGGTGGLTGGILSGVFGGKFAKGGQPPVGKVSMVGEKGPEWFVPNVRGRVIPNHEIKGMMGGSGGGGTIVNSPNYNITLSGDKATNDRTLAEIKSAQANNNREIWTQAKHRGW